MLVSCTNLKKNWKGI